MSTLTPEKLDSGSAFRMGRGIFDRRLVLAVLYTMLTVATLYPVLSVEIPVLIDLPNHLSRMHLLREIPADPALQQSYVITWGLLPNLAMDVFVTYLARLLPVFDAVRVFVALTIVTVIAGTLALSYAVHGRLGLWQTAVFLVVYNQVLAWGFVNFLFGVGVALLALAGWISLPRRAHVARLAIFSGVTVLLFFIHLLALAVFGLLIFCYEAWQTQQSRKWAARDLIVQWSLVFAPFVIPFLFWIAQSGGDLDSGTRYASPAFKLLALFAPFRFFFEYVDQATIVFAVVLLVIGLKTRSIRLAPALRWALFAFIAASLLSPHLLFGIFAVDQRLAIVTVLIAIAAMDVTIKSVRPAVIIGCLAASLFAWRVTAMTADWHFINRQYAEFRHAISDMPRGAHLLVATKPAEREGAVRPAGSNFVFWHLASLAVVDQSAFIPHTFTTRYQPIKVHPDKRAISSAEGQPLSYDFLREGAGLQRPDGAAPAHGSLMYWNDWPAHYRYLLVLDYGERENPAPEILDRFADGSFFTIYTSAPGNTK